MENENIETKPEATKAEEKPVEAKTDNGAATKEIVNTFINNGVTKDELKAVLTEMFPEKKETTEEIVNRYILGLKGDGTGR